MSQVRPGLLIAIIVFAVFAAYAFLAPATYRAQALLVVDSAAPASSANFPEPLEAARRLSEGILDRKMLEQLSRERAASNAPDAQARAASSVRESLAIDTSDAHSFSISYKDNNRERAQRVCNLLTHHAVERAPQVLVDRSAENAAERARQQQTQELAAFLALHPQLAAEPPAVGLPPDKDPALSAFHAEKANLEKRLQELDSGAASDNPYLDPSESDPKQLRRRLTEINTALAARKTALDAKPAASQLSPELRAEWKSLLDAVSKSATETPEPSSPTLVARVAAEATLPSSPIDPNRRLLLFFGVVFGGGLGTAYTLVARAAQQRRTKSSRPPKPAPSQVALTVQLPAAPLVPTDLGPAIPPAPKLPATGIAREQPQASGNGAPIVPIPQRPISSNPPPALPMAPNNGFGSTLPMQKSEPKVHQAQLVPRPPSDPPPPGAPLRFASTLVLTPGENPTPKDDPTPDPVFASAARAWDDQIRAHEVPGFAVVRPRSEPPGAKTASSMPPPLEPLEPRAPNPQPAATDKRPVSSNPPPAATIQRTTSRPPNQMKVTQPLGSFLPDGGWNDPSAGLVRSRTPQNAAQPPGSPIPARPQDNQGSTYSYVSRPPPATPVAPPPAPAPAPPPENNVAQVRPVPLGWRADPSLMPESRRALCEQLYPLAVERSVVVLVVGAPEAQEHKSRVAAELALGLAESGHPRILLMEGDLQSPRVHRLMNIDMPMGLGFSQQIRARISGGPRQWTVLGPSKSLNVLGEGLMRTPGLLLSQQFSDSVRELRGYYDFIVIDGPSASLQVESQALDAVSDAVIFVCGKAGSPALVPLDALFPVKKFKTIVTAP